MGMSQNRRVVCAGLTLALFCAVASPALAAGGTDSEREERWQDLRQSIFGERPVEDGAGLITLEAPARALDAALVPLTIRIAPEHRDDVAAVHLVIDDNPSPYAAKASFGPAGDPAVLRLRVRIDGYTNVHAVAETRDGRLHGTVAFVKASGGCSAPIGVSDEVAMQGMGEMKLRPAGPDTQGEATLLIRHPNFSGMQMNQLTRNYTPARYLDLVRISQGDQTVLELAGDISLSSDPAIGFAYRPGEADAFTVLATDSEGASWQGSFPIPAHTQ